MKSTGTTQLVAAQAGNKYYPAATSVSRQLTIELKSQTITFEAIPEKDVHGKDFPLVVSSSSGLPVKVISMAPAVATVTGNIVSIHGLGEAELIASQEGSGCFLPAESVTRTLSVRLITALEERPREKIELFPNPTNGTVTVRLSSAIKGPVSIRVLDSRGETVLDGKQFNGASYTLDLASLPAGLYMVQLTTIEGVHYKRVVKH